MSASGFFYYVVGFYLVKNKISLFKIADSISLIEYIVILIVYEFLSQTIPSFGNAFVTTIISSLFLLKISNYLIKNDFLYRCLAYLSSYSFFIYAIHSPFIESVLNKLSWKVIPLKGIGCLFQFILLVLSTVIISTILGMIVKKIFPKLFIFLCGGRRT